MGKFGLTQVQAQAILDMQLRRLANLERQKILDEYAELVKKIAYLEDLLGNPRRILTVVKEETHALKEKYGDSRRTAISAEGVSETNIEDLIPHQRVMVTLSNRGFVKRVPSESFSPQHRGGKGIIGMVTREEDAVRILAAADTHDDLLFFTNKGRVFHLKCYDIPADASRTAKGLAIINLIPLTEDEKVTALIVTKEFSPELYLLMATRDGEIKKTALSNFASVRSSGIIAMDLTPGDELVAADIAAEESEVIMVTRKGQSIRFKVSELRTSSRTSGGVKGMKLREGDQVVSLDVVVPGHFILVVSTEGFGKLTAVDNYPLQHRAGSGVLTFRVNEKTGDVAAASMVSADQQLTIIPRKA